MRRALTIAAALLAAAPAAAGATPTATSDANGFTLFDAFDPLVITTISANESSILLLSRTFPGPGCRNVPGPEFTVCPSALGGTARTPLTFIGGAPAETLNLDDADLDLNANTPLPSPIALIGADGNDTLRATRLAFTGRGGPGDDRLQGGEGRDTLLGEAGQDRLDGGNNRDVLDGGDGDDELAGGANVDRLNGGQGDDVHLALDAQTDTVTCGPGQDRAEIDQRDRVAEDCETVRRRQLGFAIVRARVTTTGRLQLTLACDERRVQPCNAAAVRIRLPQRTLTIRASTANRGERTTESAVLRRDERALLERRRRLRLVAATTTPDAIVSPVVEQTFTVPASGRSIDVSRP